MHTQDKTQPTSPRAKLEQAIHLAKSGHKTQACAMFRDIVALQPVNQAAWLWLSAVATEKAEAKVALARAKHINPNHPSLHRAEQWLIHRFSDSPPTKKSVVVKKPSPPPSGPKPSKNWFKLLNSLTFGLVVVAFLIGLLVLLLGLIWEVNVAAQIEEAVQGVGLNDNDRSQLEIAWARQDWATAIALLEKFHQAQPEDQTIKEQLSNAYIQKGVALRSRGFVEEALTNFEQALAVTPGQTRAQQERQLASAYLAGTRYYQRGQWPEAIVELERVWTQDSHYPHVRDLLYSAYYNLGLARQAAGELTQAKTALESAIGLRPDLSASRHLMAEIEFAMTPQTPLNTPILPTSIEDRLIVVGIAEQKMAVYEGDKQVFDFVVSTGEPGSDTIPGEFEIQNKIDVAYASTWNLDMPYWMGIYWAGPLQNGIHALPIVKHTGYKLWDGYLGQRVSYGCIILSDEDAASLYHWAEVGTKVKIVPSLATWSPDLEDKAGTQ